MDNFVIENPGRRTFLRAAPAAAAAGIAFAGPQLFAAHAGGQSPAAAETPKFQFFTAQSLQDDIKTWQTAPGEHSLVDGNNLPFSVVLSIEKTKGAKEFEWHEGRDHIFQIIEGSTFYELGGTPKDAHKIGPGEWLAPASEGAISITLKKGDLLVIPRGTPHRRTTADSVTFTLIAPKGRLKA